MKQQNRTPRPGAQLMLGNYPLLFRVITIDSNFLMVN